MLETLRQYFRRSMEHAQKPPRHGPSRRTALAVETLDDRVMLSATPLRLAVIGDSLSAPYPAPNPNLPPTYGSAGDLSWVQQFRNLDAGKIVIRDLAFPGATTDSLFHNEPNALVGQPEHLAQVPAAVGLIHDKAVDAAVIIIGANDVEQDLPLLFIGPTGPQTFVTTFVTTVVGNVEAAIQTVAAAGHVKLTVGNVPDVAVTPGFQSAIPAPYLPVVLPIVEQAITLANQQIEAFAAAHEVPVIDMYGLTQVLNHTVALGGVTVTNLYSPDFFHPNTVGQGILGNTVLEALHEGYDLNVRPLRLSDQQILDEAHIAHAPGRNHFDVSPYVISTEDVNEHGGDFARILEALEDRFEGHDR